MMLKCASVIAGIALVVGIVTGSAVRAGGTRSLVARPTLGAAVLQLPSTVSWRTTPNANGTFGVALTAEMDVRSVLANIKILSSKALDRSSPCGDAVKILGAAGKRRRPLHLKGCERVSANGRTAIVVDDGIARGATVRAALRVLRRQQPARLILAVPVAPDTVEALRREADEVVYLHTPEPFFAIGPYYGNFAQVTDEQVAALMQPQATTAKPP